MIILFIEDDKGLVELLSEFLSLLGYEVVYWVDGEFGLVVVLLLLDIELVLLDVMLLKFNGLDVLKSLC